MNKESIFNKELFAELLERAKGDRSINQYAIETEVSAAHISRFLRQMIEAPPTPETISKFAGKAQGAVTYRDMMIAAGYINVNSDESEDSPANRRKEIMRIEQDIFQIILQFLMNSDYRWTMEKPESRMRFPDMVFNLEDDYYKRWYLEIKAFRSRTMMPINVINNFYGMLVKFELNPTDKFTFVTIDERTFNYMLENPPLNLRANLYIMLVDLENKTVVREEKISEY